MNSEDTITIKIKQINKEDPFDITIPKNINVEDFKSLIFDATGILFYILYLIFFYIFYLKGVDVDRQRLISGGKVLKNDKDLSYYNIQDGNTIHLVCRPGMYYLFLLMD